MDYDYSINFSLKPPKPKTKEEKEENLYTQGLSREDIKLGIAIYKAMLICEVFREASLSDQGRIFLLIRYARWKQGQEKDTSDFLSYVAKIINERFSCMDNWLKYIESQL